VPLLNSYCWRHACTINLGTHPHFTLLLPNRMFRCIWYFMILNYWCVVQRMISWWIIRKDRAGSDKISRHTQSFICRLVRQRSCRFAAAKHEQVAGPKGEETVDWMTPTTTNSLSSSRSRRRRLASRSCVLRFFGAAPCGQQIKQARHDKVIIWSINGVFTFVLKD